MTQTITDRRRERLNRRLSDLKAINTVSLPSSDARRVHGEMGRLSRMLRQAREEHMDRLVQAHGVCAVLVIADK